MLRQREAPNLLGPEKLKAPYQRLLTGASSGVLAESSLNALSECTKS